MRDVLLAAGLLAGCGRIGFDSPRVTSDADASSSGRVAPSCVSLPTTCGPSGTSSCCDSPLVSGGAFYRSHDVAADGMYASTSDPATVSDFRLDRHEVTVGRFRKFVEAGMGTQASPPAAAAGAHPWISGSGWDPAWNTQLRANTADLVAQFDCEAPDFTWTDTPGANENLPMVCITWYEANAFCAWDGGFVPTEAEWNYAAAGGSEQRAYPWSSPPGSLSIDCSYTNFNDVGGLCVPNGRALPVGSTSPRGDGRWGQADLAGNAYEWTLDGYTGSYENPCDDCVELRVGSGPVVRGGSFVYTAPRVRTGARLDVSRTYRGGGLDVRCASAP